MEMSQMLKQRALPGVKTLIARLSRFRIVFTLSSLTYCAVHWLVAHGFSIYVFFGALMFGAIAATASTWLSRCFSSSSSTST
jgi:hypothetical protein